MALIGFALVLLAPLSLLWVAVGLACCQKPRVEFGDDDDDDEPASNRAPRQRHDAARSSVSLEAVSVERGARR